MESITTSDIVTINSYDFSVLYTSDIGTVGLHVMRRDSFRVVNSYSSGLGTGIDKVTSDFSLPIDHYGFPAGQCFEIDLLTTTIERDFETIVD
ncbi:hypothetical protein D3C87_1543960 [compost metagenome]